MCVLMFQLKLVTKTDGQPVGWSLLTSAVDDGDVRFFIQTKEKSRC